MATKGDEPKDSIEPKGHLIRVIRIRIWEWSTRSSNVQTSRIHGRTLLNDALNLKRINSEKGDTVSVVHAARISGSSHHDRVVHFLW